MIVCAHLLNDRSGSPRILSSAIRALRAAGEDVLLFVGSDGSGHLDEVDVPTKRYWYRHSSHRLITLFTFLFSQICLFWRLMWARNIPRDAVVYVNTLLPFAAALFGTLTSRPVVYHLHEISVTPPLVRWFLVGIANCTATKLIYVSEYHRHNMPIGRVPAQTIYNALDPSFLRCAKEAPLYQPGRGGSFRVLMLASLRDYKGIPEFIALAKRFSTRGDVSFHLVVNDDLADVSRYGLSRAPLRNLTVYTRTSDPTEHYAQSSLVVNLSRPDRWVETFGLTIIEAMAFGVPVIGPPIGGPAEVISDGIDGFLVDCRDSELLVERVRGLADDRMQCMRMSQAAREKTLKFSPEVFAAELQAAIASVRITYNLPTVY